MKKNNNNNKKKIYVLNLRHVVVMPELSHLCLLNQKLISSLHAFILLL